MKRKVFWLKLGVSLCVWLLVSLAHRQNLLSVFDGVLSDMQRQLSWSIEGFVRTIQRKPVEKPRVFAFPIDGASIRQFAREGISWPFPRNVYAQAVRRLDSLGVKAVGFDVFFSQNDAALGLDELVQSFASSSIKIVLAATLEDTGSSLQESDSTVEASEEEDDDGEEYSFQKSRRMITNPHSRLLEKAWGTGLINSDLNINFDRVFRRQPPAFLHKGKWHAGLGPALVEAAMGVRGPVELEDGKLKFSGGMQIPVEPVVGAKSVMGVEWVAEPRWRNPQGSIDQGCGAFYFSNFYDLVKGVNLWSPEKLRGSLALIGVGSDFLGDTIAIPGNNYAAGMVLHAQMADSLLERGFMQRLDWGSWWFLSEAAFLLLCIWVLWAQSRPSTWKGVALAFSGFAFVALSSLLLFLAGYSMDGSVWLVGFPVILGSVYIVGYFAEGKEKARIQDLFGKQVSPSVVQELLRDPETVLSPKRHEISVCFVDVCGFTSFSEKHSADRVLVQLNFYFSHLVRVVHQYGGTLDKFIGDAMMITTGVPLFDINHALNMIKLALEIRRQVGQINKNLPAGLEPFQVSCGINSGEAILGNVGASERMEFTVIGDTVNVASRLQGKSGPMEIVVGLRTHDLIKDYAIMEPLEPVTVKGKSAPIQAFRLVGLKE